MCLPSDLIPIDSASLYKFPNILSRALYPRISTKTEVCFSVALCIALYLVQFLSLLLNIFGMFFSLAKFLRNSNNHDKHMDAWEPNSSPKSSVRTTRVLNLWDISPAISSEWKLAYMLSTMRNGALMNVPSYWGLR